MHATRTSERHRASTVPAWSVQGRILNIHAADRFTSGTSAGLMRGECLIWWRISDTDNAQSAGCVHPTNGGLKVHHQILQISPGPKADREGRVPGRARTARQQPERPTPPRASPGLTAPG
jgi:hypothetical protein